MTERQVIVRELRWEAEQVISVLFESLEGIPLPRWEPGAHVEVILKEGLERSYSLCGDVDDAGWRVAVLREHSSRGGSDSVHRDLRPGAVLTVRGPSNHFALRPSQSYLFVAGGIGITPILPMLESASRSNARWQLIYLGRCRASMAFRDVLGHYGDRVSVLPKDEIGRVDLVELVDRTSSDADIYVCGPESLNQAVLAIGAAAGREVFVERFKPVMATEEAHSGSTFDVVLKRSGLTLAVPDGQSILSAAEAAGVFPPSSCLEGTCGSCETPVLGGVVEHRDSILTEQERRASETMMICVSRAASSQLVLDL